MIYEDVRKIFDSIGEAYQLYKVRCEITDDSNVYEDVEKKIIKDAFKTELNKEYEELYTKLNNALKPAIEDDSKERTCLDICDRIDCSNCPLSKYDDCTLNAVGVDKAYEEFHNAGFI